MSRLPKLAIIGRPNVGKSALFNRICKKKIAIVDEAEGITRDRLYSKAELFGRPFTVIDTGGIDPGSQALFNTDVKRQAEIAIEEADTIVMVVDAHIGPTDLDLSVAHILLRTDKPLCLAVNKVDDLLHEHLVHQFYSLGIKEIVTVSAAQGRHIAELLEIALKDFPSDPVEEELDDSIKVAVVGRPNVGKSTLINFLLGDDSRCIVSPIAGTTRDSIDTQLECEGVAYTLIDTAGIRRKASEHEVVDKFAAIRTERAIERADVCVLILDATQGLTTQEKHIANQIEESGKSCILLFNKWDLVSGFRMEHCLKAIQQEAPFLSHCPMVFGSAQSGRNIDKILKHVQTVHEESQKRIPTAQLNKFIEKTLQKNHPPMLNGKRLRIYYMVQIDIQPPKFLLFVNHASLMLETYKKYLYNQFRDVFGFEGNPVLFQLKSKPKRKKGNQKPTEDFPSYVRKADEPFDEDDDLSDDEEDDFSDDEFFDEEE